MKRSDFMAAMAGAIAAISTGVGVAEAAKPATRAYYLGSEALYSTTGDMIETEWTPMTSVAAWVKRFMYRRPDGRTFTETAMVTHEEVVRNPDPKAFEALVEAKKNMARQMLHDGGGFEIKHPLNVCPIEYRA